MKTQTSLEVTELLEEILGDKVNQFNLPPPSYEIMKAQIIEFDPDEKFMVVKIPVLETWLNPYGTMQGGLILGAIDNATGPLSIMIAPKNMTRNIESKLLKPITMDLEYIYVTATLFEEKKRRLIFDAVVTDKDKTIYAKARLTNWIL